MPISFKGAHFPQDMGRESDAGITGKMTMHHTKKQWLACEVFFVIFRDYG
jgi:hypothetical protein